MFSKIRGIVFLAIILGFIGLFQIGCNRNSGENPVAAPISGSDSAINNANVSFKLVFPQKDFGTQSANILPAMDALAVVTFQIKLLNYGNTSNPFFIISRQVPVVNGSASAIFESLPTTTILGQIHIENGKIQGYSDFHGALDLSQGENTVTLAPVGSLMPQDVVANALNEIVSSATLFINAPQTLVFELNKIVSGLQLGSTVAYEEVINNFSNRNGLPLVEIISPTSDQSFLLGDDISIIASATDLDGVISKIEFFQGSEKIGEAQAIPFSCSWKPLSEGPYSLAAKAFDNNSAVGVASPVLINVVVPPVTYTVNYNGNGNTSGVVPIDNLTYQQGATVTVKDNSGSFAKSGFKFAGWNTAADGSGTSYNAYSTFVMGTANITLYAVWTPCTIAISWVYQVGSSEQDSGNKIAFDKNNNILFSGYTEGVFDGISPANERDIFIKSVSQDGVGGWVTSPVKENPRQWWISGFCITNDASFLITQSMSDWKNLSKIDNSGNILWMKNFSSDFVVLPQAIVSRGEFIYVTGFTEGALDGVTTPSGGSDVFVAKLTALGEIVWLRQFGSEYGWESGVDISLDGTGNAFVSGATNGCIDGTTIPVGNNVFLAKFDNAGTMCWIKQIPGSEHAIGHQNDEFDNIFVVAAYGHILKFNANGDLVFHKTFSSGSPHSVYAMDLKGENIFIVGGSDTSVTGITNVNPNNYNISGYWLKTDGSFVAELFYGTAAPDMAEDVAFYDNNTVFITGNTDGSLAGNTNSGLGDAFLMKVKLNE